MSVCLSVTLYVTHFQIKGFDNKDKGIGRIELLGEIPLNLIWVHNQSVRSTRADPATCPPIDQVSLLQELASWRTQAGARS